MLIATTETIAGHDITQTLGLVRGNTIRARHVGRDITAALRNLVGGEVTEYTKMVAESREQALDRMVAEAEALGADAVVAVRFTTSVITSGAAELLAVGTAVKLQRR
ncbi:MAG: YbjQ family protein [Acidobacteriota bacterium]|nr:YbjQ family protein [Acidobacteriota bacterium]MDE2921768.1 YbjQ family protein [Acidobacteriota bacterium]MDE3266700.1 YbjQ family protein [Acidobacteriota bacterium]MYB18578.1 YbjQ family protein [Holophagales bacterium]MYH25297.1 YbjQ family protein [Holophagales bacterium]